MPAVIQTCHNVDKHDGNNVVTVNFFYLINLQNANALHLHHINNTELELLLNAQTIQITNLRPISY